MLRKAELSMEADSENYLGGSSETYIQTIRPCGMRFLDE